MTNSGTAFMGEFLQRRSRSKRPGNGIATSGRCDTSFDRRDEFRPGTNGIHWYERSASNVFRLRYQYEGRGFSSSAGW